MAMKSPYASASPAGTSALQRKIQPANLLLGAGVSMLEITTLGQPLEVLKTHLAAHRDCRLRDAVSQVWSRGGFKGFYQGLIPWAWIEATSAGAILIFTAAEIESLSVRQLNLSPASAGLIGGCGGGIAQAYLTMGVSTTMKTAEITRANMPNGSPSKGTMSLFLEIFKKDGIRGINKGVHAVALRQCTNWGSRMGLARLAEDGIRNIRGRPADASLSASEKLLSSTIGGALGCWNHPIEVVRVEMQSMAQPRPGRPAKLTIMNTMGFIYQENGVRGLFKGVLPRLGLSVWRTVCFVSVVDYAKAWWRGVT
ncbi:mitochondrial carrier domain-containing protein [Melampsora americana]|nr:mitochondrial carrier domain-containing protein [Melampsora americana]